MIRSPWFWLLALVTAAVLAVAALEVGIASEQLAANASKHPVGVIEAVWMVLKDLLPMVAAGATISIAVFAYRLSQAAQYRSSLYETRLRLLESVAPLVESVAHESVWIYSGLALQAMGENVKERLGTQYEPFIRRLDAFLKTGAEIRAKVMLAAIVFDEPTLKAFERLCSGLFMFTVIVDVKLLEDASGRLINGANDFRDAARRMIGCEKLDLEFAKLLDVSRDRPSKQPKN